jgi:hypothetical protein
MHPLLYQGWFSSFLCVSRVEWRMFFPRAQSNVLFMFSVTYLRILMVFLVG